MGVVSRKQELVGSCVTPDPFHAQTLMLTEGSNPLPWDPPPSVPLKLLAQQTPTKRTPTENISYERTNMRNWMERHVFFLAPISSQNRSSNYFVMLCQRLLGHYLRLFASTSTFRIGNVSASSPVLRR